jgi:flagella basal body P-ring formation protein FlgA
MRTLALLLLPPALIAQVPDSPVERLAEAALAFANAEAGKLGGKHIIKLALPPVVPMTRPGALTFEAIQLSKHDPVGRFFVLVAIKVDGERVGMTRVDLDGQWVGTLLRAKGDLARQTELSADKVDPTPFEGVPPPGALTEIPEGQRLMRWVAAGKVLTRADLEAIPLVQSGDKVRLTATRDSLTISIDTTARSRAGLGDRVRLETPGGRRQVLGIVTGPGEARLQ